MEIWSLQIQQSMIIEEAGVTAVTAAPAVVGGMDPLPGAFVVVATTTTLLCRGCHNDDIQVRERRRWWLADGEGGWRRGGWLADGAVVLAGGWCGDGCGGWSGAEGVAAAEHGERGGRRGHADPDHDHRRGRLERLGGHQPDVRERRQPDQPARGAEQRADRLPQEGQHHGPVTDRGAGPRCG